MMKRLEYLHGITDQECDLLRALGVRHTNQLVHATTLVIDRERIERRCGSPRSGSTPSASRPRSWRSQACSAISRVLMRLGVSTLRQLAETDPAELHRQLVEATGVGAPPGPTSSTG